MHWMDPDKRVRKAAAEAVGWLGADGAAAVPRLTAMVKDEHEGGEGSKGHEVSIADAVARHGF